MNKPSIRSLWTPVVLLVLLGLVIATLVMAFAPVFACTYCEGTGMLGGEREKLNWSTVCWVCSGKGRITGAKRVSRHRALKAAEAEVPKQ